MRGKAITMIAAFSRGVNFSKWFEAKSARAIQFNRFVEQDFIDVKSLGADVIRLPVKMHSMTHNAPEYVLDPLLLKFLDIAVNWAEKHELYIIIDNHSFDPITPTDVNIDKILLKVWTQLARRYKNRSKYVVYEILNEPHGIQDMRWGEIQGAAIETIRQYDTEHTIIAGGTDFNALGKLPFIPEYDDKNLIYTFHFYDPHIFTHQGAAWGKPSLASLAGIPFPYDRALMPEIPAELKGTWVENSYGNYASEANWTALSAKLDQAAAFSKERNVPVFCGEYGVYMIQSPATDRVKWFEFISNELDKRKISRTSWDYFGGFGIFKSPDAGNFKTDLNIDIVRALGFNADAC